MGKRKTNPVPPEVLAAAEQEARQLREELERGQLEDFFPPEDLDDAAPFYFVLRAFIQELRDARNAANLTLAQVAAKSELAMESLSRLENGASTNPTWKTLGMYAKAVGMKPVLTAIPIAPVPADQTRVPVTNTVIESIATWPGTQTGWLPRMEF